MSIIGIGTDIVNIARIAKLINEFGDKFLNKYFTEIEINSAKRYNGRENKNSFYSHFAKRFAAKEAFAKAVGTGLGEKIAFKDVWVENNASGQPVVKTSTKVTKMLHKSFSIDKTASYHISLSDEYPYATAFVVIENK